MPFTPLHMGPGILIKALLQGSFSLMVFGWTQIVMDTQVLFAIATNATKLHGFSHTFIGATLLGIFSALTGKYLSEAGLCLLSIHDRSVKIGWRIAFISAFVGSYTHVAIDAVMHSDMAPYYPFTSSNHFLGIISISRLHKFCLYSALIGGVLYYVVAWRKNTSNQEIL